MFCHRCGAKLVDQARFCHKCGTRMDEGSRFCMTCGAALYISAMPPDGRPQYELAATDRPASPQPLTSRPSVPGMAVPSAKGTLSSCMRMLAELTRHRKIAAVAVIVAIVVALAGILGYQTGLISLKKGDVAELYSDARSRPTFLKCGLMSDSLLRVMVGEAYLDEAEFTRSADLYILSTLYKTGDAKKIYSSARREAQNINETPEGYDSYGCALNSSSCGIAQASELRYKKVNTNYGSFEYAVGKIGDDDFLWIYVRNVVT